MNRSLLASEFSIKYIASNLTQPLNRPSAHSTVPEAHPARNESLWAAVGDEMADHHEVIETVLFVSGKSRRLPVARAMLISNFEASALCSKPIGTPQMPLEGTICAFGHLAALNLRCR
jgi:hypothetical protein